MYVRNVARKKAIQYKSRQEIEMSSTSPARRGLPCLPVGRRLPTSLPTGKAGGHFKVEYWVTVKEADNY